MALNGLRVAEGSEVRKKEAPPGRKPEAPGRRGYERTKEKD